MLTKFHREWASKSKQKVSPSELRLFVKNKRGCCTLSGVKMIFDKKQGTPEPGGKGCHPLYAAVDHISPENPKAGFQLICYALNDLKGHLPLTCFKALSKTKAWKELMRKWKQQAQKNPDDRDAFRNLIRPRI
ncbi:MAG: hypothetical protein HY796_09615 [Elusimicrobia bacterium]|nr:hypothetical protein [Elusimicrobiota bacterium]